MHSAQHYYQGGCLCKKTTYQARGASINPHICSCTMCQKSSGAPTVAWVAFPLATFTWTKNKPKYYQSSAKTQRCFCASCGSFLGAMDQGCENISITITTLDNPNLIPPNLKQHSYIASKPSWWMAKKP